MNKVKQILLILAVIATTQTSKAMIYNTSKSSADLLLLFRGINGSVTPCVEVDLGNVTNLLNLAPNATADMGSYGYIANQVKTNYSNSYGNAIFTVIGTAVTGAQGGLWATDSSSGTPSGFQSTVYNSIKGLVGGIGGDASAQTSDVQGSNFVCTASNDAQAYYYLVTTANSQPTTTIPTFGGNLSFTDESLPTNSMNFYQFSQTNGLSSPYSPQLIGTFSMNATSGAITFTRAGTVTRTLVPSQIVGMVRSGSSTQVSFTTTNGDNYQLLYMTSLNQAGWITNSSAGVVTGNNATNVLNDTTTDQERFYRIQSF